MKLYKCQGTCGRHVVSGGSRFGLKCALNWCSHYNKKMDIIDYSLGDHQTIDLWQVSTENDSEGRTTAVLGFYLGNIFDVIEECLPKMTFRLWIKPVKIIEIEHDPENYRRFIEHDRYTLTRLQIDLVKGNVYGGDNVNVALLTEYAKEKINES